MAGHGHEQVHRHGEGRGGAEAVAALPVHPALPRLTRNAAKVEMYNAETYFRESHRDLESVLGPDLEDVLLRHGLVILKPDGYGLGVTGDVVDFYAENGLRVVEALELDFGPLLWRAMWIHQMTLASMDRLAVIDGVISGRALALVLRADDTGGLPAAVRISDLKGPAKPEDQPENCLRRRISQPHRIFSLVHSADDPADVVRELGILLTPRERRALARVLGGEPSLVADDAVARARALGAIPARRFDVEASRATVLAAIARRRDDDLDPVLDDRLEEAARSIATGRDVSVPRVAAVLEDADCDVDPWDLAVVTCGEIDFDEPGAHKVVDNLGPSVW